MKLLDTVRFLFLSVILAGAFLCHGQPPSEEENFIKKLKRTESPPSDLLSSRSVVLFSTPSSQSDLEELQKGFQQIGIDAISYVESERALAGTDMMNAYSRYFTKRNIRILIFLKKEKGEFDLYFILFNGTPHWTDPEQVSWHVHSMRIAGALQTIYRAVISSQKRQNFLVNDYPERSSSLSAISSAGRRDENLAPNIRALRVAVPRTDDAATDAELEKYLKENFPAKFEMVDMHVDEKTLLEKGFVYVLRFVHTSGGVAKQILSYDMENAESAFMSVGYPGGNMQLKTIPAEYPIYKFYIKHLEDQISYLGLKWDADVTWQEALKNHIDGYRAAGRLN